MAIFGIGAGKILAGVVGGALLGKGAKSKDPFTRGFVRGFAGEKGGGVSGILKADMERTQERIDRIADYKIRREEKDAERYQKELREATDKIKGISGKVGGVDGAEYLVRNYGLAGAEEQATKIQNLQEIYGKDVINLDFITKDENTTTIEDLAKFSVYAPRKTDVSSLPSSVIQDTSLFASMGMGRNIGAEVQKQVDTVTAKIVNGEDVDLGEEVKLGGDLDLGMQLNPKNEIYRLTNMALKVKDSNPKRYDELMKKANKLKFIIDEVERGPKELSISQASTSLKQFKNHIIDIAGVKGDFTVTSFGKEFKKASGSAFEEGKVATAASILTQLYGEALRKGMKPEDILPTIFKAMEQNKLPTLIPRVDDPSKFDFELTTEDQLIPGGFAGGFNEYAQAPDEISSNETLNPADGLSVGQLITQYNQSGSDTERDSLLPTIISKLLAENKKPKFNPSNTKITGTMPIN